MTHAPPPEPRTGSQVQAEAGSASENGRAAAKSPPEANGENTRRPKRAKRAVPEGLWLRCPGCSDAIYRKQLEAQLSVCPKCEYHFYVSAPTRIRQVLDDGTFEEWDASVRPTDPLQFADKKSYAER